MNAVILAGGFGTRLKPLTDSCPKPMLPIACRPMLDYTVAQLHAYGLDKPIFTLGYKSEQIIRFVSGYEGLETGYYIERTPLGTCGGVKAACGACGSTFVVISGDALSDIDLAGLIAQHYATGATVTMAVAKVATPQLYGVVECDGDGRVTHFIEKPKHYRGDAWVNCGVYCIEKSILEFVPENCPFDFSRDLFPVLVSCGELWAYKHEGYWSDIGDIDSYYRANFDMASGGFYPFIPNAHTADILYAADSTVYDERAVLEGEYRRSVIGNARISGAGSVDECVVLSGATVAEPHFRRIIGRDFVVPLESSPNFVENNKHFFEKQLV